MVGLVCADAFLAHIPAANRNKLRQHTNFRNAILNPFMVTFPRLKWDTCDSASWPNTKRTSLHQHAKNVRRHARMRSLSAKLDAALSFEGMQAQTPNRTYEGRDLEPNIRLQKVARVVSTGQSSSTGAEGLVSRVLPMCPGWTVLEWRARGDDFRTFLGNFVAALPHLKWPGSSARLAAPCV